MTALLGHDGHAEDVVAVLGAWLACRGHGDHSQDIVAIQRARWPFPGHGGLAGGLVEGMHGGLTESTVAMQQEW